MLYRIKQILKTGIVNYSNVLVVKKNNFQERILVSPNPLKNQLNVSISSNEICIANIDIYNSLGQLLFERKVDLQKGVITTIVDDVGILPKGIYVLQVKTTNGCYIQKIIKD